MMGGGSWTPHDWDGYSTRSIKGKSTAAIYTSKSIKPKYDPKNVDIRESCDSDEHPESTAIIIGLDVTGSMAGILQAVAEKLGVLVGEILDRQPVSDPQIMFNAIGDATCDDAPLQVTQFESDIRIAEQLTDLWFEQGGGGNNFESYPLVWYFAANHTMEIAEVLKWVKSKTPQNDMQASVIKGLALGRIELSLNCAGIDAEGGG